MGFNAKSWYVMVIHDTAGCYPPFWESSTCPRHVAVDEHKRTMMLELITRGPVALSSVFITLLPNGCMRHFQTHPHPLSVISNSTTSPENLIKSHQITIKSHISQDVNRIGGLSFQQHQRLLMVILLCQMGIVC